MAKKSTPTKNLDWDVEKELEDALNLSLTGGGGLDKFAPIDDFEAQISQAAAELAQESSKQKPVATTPKSAPNPTIAPIKQADAESSMQFRSIESSLPLQPEGFKPANDERQKDYKSLLHGLNRRASSAIYWIVSLVSIAWVAAAVALVDRLWTPSIWAMRSLNDVLARPDLLMLVLAIVIPITLLWAFATMIRRAHEMSIAAQSMTEMAFRLAEPENMAQDRIMLVGQAVRHEVAAMSESIERTLARAVELETIVHTEVDQIERSYSENVARIRSLVDSLGSEREAVVSHAEHVSASIAGAHETLRNELGSASDIIRDSVLNASTKLSMTITNSGDSLIDRLNEGGLCLCEAIDTRMDSVSDRLSTSGEAFVSLLDTSIAKLTQSTDEVSCSLTDLLNDRTSGTISLLMGAAKAINSEFEASLHGIEHTLTERGQALISEFQTRVEALDTGTAKLNGTLEARVCQINKTLVERTREIAKTFVEGHAILASALEKDIDNIKTLIDGHSEKIAAERAGLAKSLESNLEGVQFLIEGYSNTIESDCAKLSRTLETDIAAVHGLIEYHSSKLVEERTLLSKTLESDLGKLAESCAGIDDLIAGQVERWVEGRETLKRELEADLHTIQNTMSTQSTKLVSDRAALSRSIEADINNVNDLVAVHAERLIAERSLLSKALEDDLAKLATSRSGIDGLVANQVEKLAEGCDILKRAMSAYLAKIDGMVLGQVNKLAAGRDALTKALESDLAILNESRGYIDDIVVGHVNKISEGRDIIARALEDDLAKLGDTRHEIDLAVSGHIDQIAARRVDISDAIASDIEKIEETFRRQTGVFEERTGTMERALSLGVDNVRGVLEKSAVFVAGVMREKVVEVTSAMHEQASQSFTDADCLIAERAEQISAAFLARAEDIARAFDDADKRLTARAYETSSSLMARAEETTDMLSAKAGEIAATFDAADRSLIARTIETADLLSARASDIMRNFDNADERLDMSIGELADTLAARAAEFGCIVDTADEKIAARIIELTSGISEHAKQIANAFTETEQRVVARAHRTAADLDAHTKEIEETLANVDERLVTSADSIASCINEHLSSAENRLACGAESMGQQLNERVAQAEAQLVARANVITETFTAVSQHIGQSTNEAARTIDANTRELNSILSDRSNEIAKILDETARPLVDRFVEGSTELQRNMEEVTARASEKLRVENAALVDALSICTSETLSAVDGARSTLAESMVNLIDRMTASSSQLGELIGRAAQNLATVDDHLTGSTANFAATTEKAAQTFSNAARLVDSNTKRLTDLSSSTLREVASIATKFDEHSRLLSSASNLLDSAQSDLEHTLERQSSLEELAIGLVKKSEDIKHVMQSFERLVGQTLESAEGKTMESTEKIRAAISDVVETATKRFADATEDMRRTADSIKTELESTRTELRKGVLDMPEEAKESTNAIRRAVSEQINALKELSAIVAKSGRTVDVSDTSLLSVQQPAPRRSASQPEQSREQLAPQVPLSGVSLRSMLDIERPVSETQPTAHGGQHGDWVYDPLTSASRDQHLAQIACPSQPEPSVVPAQYSPLHVVASLNSLSVDVASAIDHDAAIELWDRYRRGERDVFTRRLYTLKGQQTFDEIRRKYNGDSEFRAAVDRYCNDFERLLKEVSRNDCDSAMTKTYLISDTGKIYTMLAHAAGRLN